MKCNACGAVNDAHHIECSFCGQLINNSNSSFSSDIINKEDKFSRFVKKHINSDGQEVL
jgi:hypothetical protein